MSILITGSSGYIGTELCRRLEQDTTVDEVIGVDFLPPRESFEKLTFYERDCCGDLTDIFDGHKVDTVVQNHVEQFGVGRLVVTSSGTAYGAYSDNPDRLTEEMPIRGHDYQYANDKRIVEEKLAEFQARHSEVDVVIARPAVVCGAHVGNFISRYVSKPWVPLVKDSTAKVQLLHEEDAANALYALVKEADRGAYNLGPEESLTQEELVAIAGGRAVRLGPRTIRWLTSIGWALRLRFLTRSR